MKNVSTLLAISALITPHTTQAFAPSSGECSTRTRTHLSATASTRRNFLSTGIATAAAASTLVLSPLPGVADLSDGNALPQGAAQFSRVIKVRSQLKSVAKRVAEQPSEIDKKEWDKIDDFLRTVYSAGEDMKFIAKGIFDPDKKTKADQDIKLLQSLVQAAQKPVSKQDSAGFAIIAEKADGLFEDFMDQLRDVPADL
eukprot:CAMPEP_0181100310 /NCGR_PEP_ID=MMETSP1071-20121207/13125_1 /TAXON_ID=35127 /ORGANISM="Thalassiosira sp., Strain NH16" /LENGTH=198 /DNA_ID=CAMNT_0023183031 /DNA_START=58 /DNA_END=654 /DNA_ORIENTATION=-